MVRVFALSCLALAVGAGVALAADDGSCLRYQDLDGIHKVNQSTLVAKKKGGGRYEIKVDEQCRYLEFPQDYFVTRNNSPSECVRPGDALVLNRGGNCFVQSVTPMSAASTN
jgi:hypothetical protein